MLTSFLMRGWVAGFVCGVSCWWGRWQRQIMDPGWGVRGEVSAGQVAAARVSGQAFHATSLDAPVAEQEDAATLGELLGGEDRGLELALDMEALRTHWQELTGQEQELLLLRFYGNMTQTQIAQRLGVSQMQVSRLLRRVLAYLRDRICGAAAPSLRPSGAGAGPVTGAGPGGGPVPRGSG